MPRNIEPRLRMILFSLLIGIAAIYLISIVWNILRYFSGVFALFFAAWLISFMLSPVTNWLQQRGLPRLLAVVSIYLALASILSLVIVLAVPLLSAQISHLADRVNILTTPASLAQLDRQSIHILTQFGLTPNDARSIIARITGDLRAAIQTSASDALNNSTQLLGSIAAILLDTVIALIISFYMMLDGRRVMDNQIQRLPIAWREDVRSFENEVGRVFGGFIRSQMVIGLSYGFLTWLTLVGLGLPNGFLISMLTGLIMIIPFAGPFLAIIPPMGLALLELPAASLIRDEIILLVLLFIAQQIVMQGLAPRIMSQGVGLHPLWLFAALLAGARVAGVWGAFFAAPVAALAAVVFRQLHARWARNNPLFHPPTTTRDDDEADDMEPDQHEADQASSGDEDTSRPRKPMKWIARTG